MARFSVVVFPRRHHRQAAPQEASKVIDLTGASEERRVPRPAQPVAPSRASATDRDDDNDTSSDHTRAAS